MNKIYKLVYSKALNSLVAVSEIATRSTAATSSQVDVNETEKLSGGSNNSANLNKLALTFVLSSLFAGLPLAASAASGPQVDKKVIGDVAAATVDSSADQSSHLNYISQAGYNETNAGIVAQNNGPTVKYVNGVPVVDIVNAQNGISDNRFTKFNTDTGVVFNNLQNGSVAVDSKILQQKLAANPNLQQAAKTILAQITGQDKSVIKGALEVLGQKADLLVINPNGIDLNGVELVNVKEFTASTADVSANNWKELNVTRGELNVNDTLTSEDVDVIRLIAAAVKVKASIAPKNATSKKANIVVAGGKQKYDLQQEKAIQTVNDPSAEKRVVISGSALGSMYGNQVNFVVTESGAGVDYEGIVIGENDLKITADGDIKLGTTYAKGTNTIESKHGNVEFNKGASAKSLSKVLVKAQNVDTSKGVLHASEEVKVEAQDGAFLGDVQANNVKIAASRYVRSAAGTKIKANDLDINVNQFAIFEGKVVANQHLAINQDQVNNSDIKTDIRFNDEVVVSGVADIVARNVAFNGNQTAEQVADDLTKAMFRFDTLNLHVTAPESALEKAAVSVVNGKLVTNHLTLTSNKSTNLNQDFVKVQNAKVKVYEDATITLNRDDLGGDIITENSFDRLNTLANVLNAGKTTFKVRDVLISSDQSAKFNGNTRFIANKFTNLGVIATDNSLTIDSAHTVANTGLMFVKGNFNISAKESVTLNGNIWSYADLNIKAPTVTQSAQVSVGGNMDVQANNYRMTSGIEGFAQLDNRYQWSEKVNWHYHALRKDKYKIGAWLAKINTSNLQFNTVETNVLGNFSLTPYANTDKAAKSNFVMENGRLYVGGEAYIKGDVAVKTTTFKVKVKDFLDFQNGIILSHTPVSLLNSQLTESTDQVFTSLYELLDKTLLGTSNDMIRRNIMGYKIDQDQIMNTLKQFDFDPIYNQMLSAVFGTNWKNLNYQDLAKKWSYFKENQNDFNIALFAPNSELMAIGKFTQENGKVYIGADKEGKEISKVNRAKNGLSTEVLVESSDNLLIREKISGLKTFENYVKQFDSQIKNVDGKLVAKNVADWETGVDLASTAEGREVGADNATLGLVVYEQFKDMVGGYGAAGRDSKAVLQHFVDSTNEAKRIRNSAVETENHTYLVTINGKQKEFISMSDLNFYVDANYDQIKWEDGSNESVVPRLSLSIPTLNKSTNFNEVAGSVSSSTSITMKDVEKLDVNYGSINSRKVEINAKGGINLVGLAGQNSINSDETTITTEENLHSVGNLKLGEATIEALGDAQFDATPFLTHKGYLGHQGLIKTENLSVKAKNIGLDAVKVEATKDVNLEAEDTVALKASHDEASSFKSINKNSEHSGRQIGQDAQFVAGSAVKGDNVNIDAKKVELESSKVKATNEANINTEELTTTAKADQKDIKGVEEKVQFVASAQGNFGSASAGAAVQFLDNRDINGNLDDRYATYATAAAPVQESGQGTVSAGLTLNKQTTNLETYDAEHVNNELNAKTLNINVDKTAELGNTNINTNGEGISLKDMEKTANINAGEVKQTNAKDISKVSTDKNSWTYGLEAHASSSIVDAASHITSAARAGALGEKVDATYALTAIGDVTGLLTRDALSGGVKATLAHKKTTASAETVSDSRNNMAGTVNINADGDVKLKAVDGTLKDLNVKAKNFEVEGGTSETKKTYTSDSVSVSADVGVGAGIAGASGSLSTSVATASSRSETNSVHHDVSRINADNININVDDKVDLTSTVLNGANTNVKAKDITVKSELDTEVTKSTGSGWSASAGTSLGTKMVPFGSGGAFYEKHGTDKAVVGTISGITGKKVNVTADNSLNLVGAVVSAKEEGHINAKEINSVGLDVHEHTDGFKGGVNIGTNVQGGSIIGTLTGGRDAQTHYEAKIKSTISDNMHINPDAVYNSANQDELNRDVNKIIDVKRDDRIQGTAFEITGSTTVIKDAKDAFNKLAEKAGNAAEALKSYIHEKVSKAPQGSYEYVGNSETAGFNNHYVSNDFGGPKGGYSNNNYYAASNPYATTYTNGGSGSALAYAPGTNNPYASYGGGRFNSDGTFSSARGNSGLDFNAVSMNSDIIASTFAERPVNASLTNSQLAYGNLNSAERASGAEGIRRVNDNTMDHGVSLGGIQDVNFENVLTSARTFDDNTDDKLNFGGDPSSSINFTDDGFNFGGNENVIPDHNGVDFGGMSPAERNDLINSAKDADAINKEINNKAGSINSGLQGGMSSNTDGEGSGTGTGSSGFGGTGSGTNYGSGSGSTGTGSSSSAGGSAGNTGSTGAGSVDFGHTNTDDGEFGLDFSGSNTSTGSTVVSGAAGNGNGAASTGGATITENTNNIVSGGTSNAVDSGNVTTSGKTDSVISSNTDSSATSTSSTSKPAKPTEGSSSTDSSSSSTLASTPAVEDGNKANSADNGANSSAVDTDAETAKVATEAAKEIATKEYTPADGNADAGDDISMGNSAKVTKYQIGNLACYVLNTNAEAQKQLQKAKSGDRSGFEKFIRNTSKERATLFSTYSQGFETALGDGGVICVPNKSEVMKTDYSVYQSNGDIPIIKTVSDKKDSKPLEAVVVTERKVVRVKVVSNVASETKKVVYQPSTVKVQEVKQIKETLASKGIDSSKIMILGVKSGSTESVAKALEKKVSKY